MKQRHRDMIIVAAVAFANHALTFLAYDWYAGVDGYSYDACGLQLVTGCFFDLFPVMLREPLIPLVKNVLYVLFENNVCALGAVIHALGIAAAVLSCRLGSRFGRRVGLALGLIFAVYLPISVYFHHISSPTIFIPLLLVCADRLCAWLKKPTVRRLLLLACSVTAAFLAKSEALLFIPIVIACGFSCRVRWQHAALFLLITGGAYAGVSFWYYQTLGYFGLTHKAGWVLFERMYRPPDRMFDPAAGPASAHVSAILDREIIRMIDRYDPRSAQMSAFMFAQKELGYAAADALFLRASLEGIRKRPTAFLYYTAVRAASHLGLMNGRGLDHREFHSETNTGHMWGFSSGRMIRDQADYAGLKENFECSPGPLQWEREMISSGFRRSAGRRSRASWPARWARFDQNLFFNPDGSLSAPYRSDANMSERLWTCRDLDRYFYFCFWGRKGYNTTALSALAVWDLFMPGANARRYIDTALMLFWFLAVFFLKRPWQRCALGGLLLYVFGAAGLQAVFSDNFGGRFVLYTKVYVWLGGLCGIAALWHNLREGHGGNRRRNVR